MSVHTSPCDIFRPDLVAFLDGELPADQAHGVRQHLKSCDDCRRESEALGAAWDMLGRLDQPRLARSLTGSILARIRSEPGLSTGLRPAFGAQVPAPTAIPAVVMPAARPVQSGLGQSGLGQSGPARSGPPAGRRIFSLTTKFAAAAACLAMALLAKAWYDHSGAAPAAPVEAPVVNAEPAPAPAPVEPPAADEVLPPQIRAENLAQFAELREKFLTPGRPSFDYGTQEPSPLLPESVAFTESQEPKIVPGEDGTMMIKMGRMMGADINSN